MTDKMSGWDTFNQLPTQELRKLLRPNIVRMDQRAIESIKEKIKIEEYVNEMQREWLQENRQELSNKVC